ncbi:MAG: LysR family transcriptional regulator [Anaerocolumna sp.]
MATLKQLKTFIAVAETQKMSEAAKKLYLSQPTVSQIISDLEEEYEVILFKRYPKQLEITPMGKLFLERALNVITSYENLNQFMENSREIRPLRVGVTLTIGDTMIGAIADGLRKNYPDIEASVFIENTRILEHRLVHNELDLALVEGIISNDKIVTKPIQKDYLQLICSTEHPFAKKEELRIEELRNQHFIMREAGSGTRDIFESLMTARHIPINIIWESYSATAIIDAVRRNFGIAVISARYLKNYYDTNRLHACPIKDITMERFFYLCYNQCHAVNSQMAHFIDIVESAV